MIFYVFIDLRTMGERLKSRYYVSKRLFIADMTRIFTNCRLYNSPDTDYYRYIIMRFNSIFLQFLVFKSI